MQIAETIKRTKQIIDVARSDGKSIGFVPTMGALHSGHISLIEAAAEKCDFVVVSIFVNPTQFAPSEDLGQYPRSRDEDLRVCKKHKTNLVFIPEAKQLYPAEQLAWVDVENLSDKLCGKFRPGHFRGVATVCAKLFNIIQPDFVFFGQKDAQQAVIIRKMLADLAFPIETIVRPTVREADGLAISSRNRYLSAKQRKAAPLIYESLRKCRQLIDSGHKEVSFLAEQMEKMLASSAHIRPEYIEIVKADDLGGIKTVRGKVIIAVAAHIGPARLIDNIIVDAD